jgi:OmpR-family two-component system manganese-sensing sensor histidine kinase
LQTSAREPESGPFALERRLLLSYLAAFAAIFLVAAVAVRFAVVGIIDQQMATRLQDVARAGLRSVLFVDDTLKIDKTEISNAALLTRDQGLQWFDRHGRLLAVEGFTPRSQTLEVEGRHQLTGEQHVFNSVTMPILNPKTQQRVGTVRATEWNEQERTDISYLDTGLLVGTLLAIVASAAGGLALARKAVRPVAQSFQTLREFTANASHELRGPLTAISTSADAALRDAKRDPAHDRSRFQAIADGAKQMSRLTSDLLLLAGADRSLERELFAVDLNAALNQLAGQYRTRFSEAGVELSFGTEKATIVYGNPHQIERIVANLLENALRYTPAGGRVSVESRRDGADILVTVRDSGIGIAPEYLDRIFERFWRADPARSPGGSGLGLAIARALARRHGGDVTVTSRSGLGSTFVASFPVRPRLHRTRILRLPIS